MHCNFASLSYIIIHTLKHLEKYEHLIHEGKFQITKFHLKSYIKVKISSNVSHLCLFSVVDDAQDVHGVFTKGEVMS